MSLSIIKHHDHAVAKLVRDVTHVHPDWVHEQLGTQSEAELQHFLDACDQAEFAKNSGQPDSAGVFMPDEGQAEPCLFRLPRKHKPEVTATIHITGIGPVAIETDLDKVLLVGHVTRLGYPVNCKAKKVSRNKRTAKQAADPDAAWLTEIMPGHFMQHPRRHKGLTTPATDGHPLSPKPYPLTPTLPSPSTQESTDAS